MLRVLSYPRMYRNLRMYNQVSCSAGSEQTVLWVRTIVATKKPWIVDILI
ncbi:MAG: hypothetical protein WBH84_06930 [Defluviitoga tunisiensis]|jgi:hypothetical protein|nr:hypothetical protein [Defluviitoga tunisiensis]